MQGMPSTVPLKAEQGKMARSAPRINITASASFQEPVAPSGLGLLHVCSLYTSHHMYLALNIIFCLQAWQSAPHPQDHLAHWRLCRPVRASSPCGRPQTGSRPQAPVGRSVRGLALQCLPLVHLSKFIILSSCAGAEYLRCNADLLLSSMAAPSATAMRIPVKPEVRLML